MAVHRDSSEAEPELAEPNRASPTRRFARLVGSPAARRVAIPRLIVAGAVALGLVVLGGYGITRLARMVQTWVAAQPEHQIRFDAIELVPPPEPWVVDGKQCILEGIRTEAKLGESFSLIEADLKELGLAFRRSPWIKDVIRLDRSKYGRLIVQVQYRTPVAVLIAEVDSRPVAYPIDEEAVPLPIESIRWASTNTPIRIEGANEPLIEIRKVKLRGLVKYGVPWKLAYSASSLDDRDDPVVLQAARLAQFLQARMKSAGENPQFPRLTEIALPVDPGHPFHLFDGARNQIRWGKAPGDDKPGELTSEARWNLLREWVAKNGPLQARYPRFLYFDRTEARVSPLANPKR